MEYEAWINKLLFGKSIERESYLQIYNYSIMYDVRASIWIDWKHLPFTCMRITHTSLKYSGRNYYSTFTCRCDWFEVNVDESDYLFGFFYQ